MITSLLAPKEEVGEEEELIAFAWTLTTGAFIAREYCDRRTHSDRFLPPPTPPTPISPPIGLFFQTLMVLSSLPENTIGIAVRNAEDFRFFFGEGIVEEDELRPFLESFDGPVLILSDDNDYAVRLRTFLKNPIHLPFEKTEISTDVRAFLEFLTLSRCSKVFGFKDSSFAHQAALFGGSSYEVLFPHAKTF